MSQTPLTPGFRRMRLAQWARETGVARITAYRMLRQGILPVPFERSPTGRWYVLVPETGRGRLVIYARAEPGPAQGRIINAQTAAAMRWAEERRSEVFTTVSEVARPLRDPMPRLERLLADGDVTFILIDTVDVLGPMLYRLLVAALTPQGRAILLADSKARGTQGAR